MVSSRGSPRWENRKVTCDSISSLLLEFRSKETCWQSHAPFPLRFASEDMSQHKAAVTMTIASEIAVLLGLTNEDQSTTISYTFPPGFHHDDANPEKNPRSLERVGVERCKGT